jgi:sugar-specific transcriptional regulator TrmB
MESTEAAEHVDILNNLGLTLSEAKVFYALSELGTSTVSEISKMSGVAREFVYLVMPKLVKKSLVEVLITVPKKFKAIPMEEAYRILLRRKEEENRELCAKAKEALKRRKNKNAAETADKYRTSLVPSREAPDPRIGLEYRKVQKSVDFTFPVGKFLQWSQFYADFGIAEAMKRNVKMRIITQHQLLEILERQPMLFTPSLKSKLSYIDFRYVPERFSVEMMIFDRKTLFVSTTEKSDINKMIWLETNNPLIVEMANGYFEGLWEKASES